MTEDAFASALAGLVSAWTGVDPSVVPRGALGKAIAAEVARGARLDQVLERAARGEPGTRERLCEAASVGETYFFRNPEQLEFVARRLVPGLPRTEGRLRAWSAGCATGEEAYSLAALLLEHRPASVLGTDLVPRQIARAREGVYGRWSVRAPEPLRAGVLREHPAGHAVSDEVRGLATFEVHNLLDPPPGRFELVLCRNVLVYFSPAAATLALANLASALAPGGVLVVAPLDLARAALPPDLVLAGPPEFQVYARAIAALPCETPPAAPPAPALAVEPPRPAPRPAATETPTRSERVSPRSGQAGPAGAREPSEVVPVARHLAAIAAIERGERAQAGELLAELVRRHPDYLPGLAEQALLLARTGKVQRALALMREVARRASALAPDAVLEAPEPTHASFYAASAKAFLERYDGPPA